jgi:hypothetical protein
MVCGVCVMEHECVCVCVWMLAHGPWVIRGAERVQGTIVYGSACIQG